MARALLPTTWFTDYWPDYAATASANVAEALALAEEIGDDDLQLDALAASLASRGRGRQPGQVARSCSHGWSGAATR